MGTAIAKAQRQESLAAQVQPRGREAGELQVEGGRELGGTVGGGGGRQRAGPGRAGVVGCDKGWQ